MPGYLITLCGLGLLLGFSGWDGGQVESRVREELMRLHELQRKAHLEKNAALLVSTFADDYTNLSAGEVKRPRREDVTKRLQGYFDRSEFLAWDDITPPVIKISADGTMAYMIVHKRVRIRPHDQKEAPVEEVIFAWLETWEKRGGQWKLAVVASTNAPANTK